MMIQEHVLLVSVHSRFCQVGHVPGLTYFVGPGTMLMSTNIVVTYSNIVVSYSSRASDIVVWTGQPLYQ